MDETYFLFSEKAKRNISDRKPRKRGGKAKYRGISNDQICVLVARDRLSVVVPEEGNPDSTKQYLEDLYRSGKNINIPELAETLANESIRALELLEKYGLQFFKEEQRYVKRKPPGHTYPRSVPTIWDGYSYMARGASFMSPLHMRATEQGIRMLNKMIITELIKKDGRVVGAVAYNPADHEMIMISSKATIIASGGAGWIFAKTNNTIGITGDSYALAYHAGATLVDMEFVQFYPTEMIKLKMPASNPLFGDGAVLRNKFGDRFMEKYDPAGDMATRDKMAQAIFMEVEAGNGIEGGVYFDCSGIPREILENKYAHFCKQLRKKGVEPTKDYVIVSPTTHYYLGGIKINPKCESTVPGLYAAGESSGGIHGANRLSGNSIADTVVFGAIAGNSAADFAKHNKQVKLKNEDIRLPDYGNQGSRYSVQEKKEQLRHLMWKHASVIREEQGLLQGLEELVEIKKSLSDIAVKDEKDFVAMYELQNMMTVSEMLLKGALQRRESRGSHWRRDFPETKAEYLGNFYYVKQGEDCNITFAAKVEKALKQ